MEFDISKEKIESTYKKIKSHIIILKHHWFLQQN